MRRFTRMLRLMLWHGQEEHLQVKMQMAKDDAAYCERELVKVRAKIMVESARKCSAQSSRAILANARREL